MTPKKIHSALRAQPWMGGQPKKILWALRAHFEMGRLPKKFVGGASFHLPTAGRMVAASHHPSPPLGRRPFPVESWVQNISLGTVGSQMTIHWGHQILFVCNPMQSFSPAFRPLPGCKCPKIFFNGTAAPPGLKETPGRFFNANGTPPGWTEPP